MRATKPKAEERALLQAWMPASLKAKIESAAAAEGLTVALYVRRVFTRKFGG